VQASTFTTLMTDSTFCRYSFSDVISKCGVGLMVYNIGIRKSYHEEQGLHEGLNSMAGHNDPEK